MAEMDAEKIRQMLKYFNRFMLLMWRLGLGPWVNIWPEFIGRIMVITHTGRVTGLRRRTPVNYAIVDDEIYCLAAYGGGTDWYRNMVANHDVQVWLPDGWWAGEMADVSDAEDRLSLLRQVLIASGFAAPMFAGFDPKAISDEELDERTKAYRLVHIRRTRACTCPGGPGEMFIVWPLAVMISIALLCYILFFRKRR